MDESFSMVEYVRGVETAEERSRRIYIDDLVNEVHRDHSEFLFIYLALITRISLTGEQDPSNRCRNKVS